MISLSSVIKSIKMFPLPLLVPQAFGVERQVRNPPFRFDPEKPGQVQPEDLSPIIFSDFRVSISLAQIFRNLKFPEALDRGAHLCAEPRVVSAPNDTVRTDKTKGLADDARKF